MLNRPNLTATNDYKLRQKAEELNNRLININYKYIIKSEQGLNMVTFTVMMCYNSPNGVLSRECYRGTYKNAEAYLRGLSDALTLIGI